MDKVLVPGGQRAAVFRQRHSQSQVVGWRSVKQDRPVVDDLSRQGPGAVGPLVQPHLTTRVTTGQRAVPGSADRQQIPVPGQRNAPTKGFIGSASFDGGAAQLVHASACVPLVNVHLSSVVRQGLWRADGHHKPVGRHGHGFAEQVARGTRKGRPARSPEVACQRVHCRGAGVGVGPRGANHQHAPAAGDGHLATKVARVGSFQPLPPASPNGRRRHVYRHRPVGK